MENERSIRKREKMQIRVKKFRAVKRLKTKAELKVNNILDKLYERVRHTQEESGDHSYEEDSVQEEEDESDDRNVDDNISDKEDRSEEDSDDNNENEGMHANLLPEEQDNVEALREWAIDGNVSRILVTKLLTILRRRAMPNLPKTADTL